MITLIKSRKMCQYYRGFSRSFCFRTGNYWTPVANLCKKHYEWVTR